MSDIYATGYNSMGQLGLGHTKNVWTLEEVSFDSRNIAKIICGTSHTFLSKGKICRKCGCGFIPTRLSDNLLYVKRYLDNLGIMDDIRKVIFIFCARMSAERTCRDGGCCIY